MNGTQLIENLNWIGRTNDLIEKIEVKEEEDIGGESEDDDDNDDGEQLKKQCNK